MKKFAFTFAFVAAMVGSASAHVPFQDPFGGWLKTTGTASLDKTLEGPWKTVGIEAAEKDYGPMLKNVALQDNVGFESHGWL